MKRFFTTPSVIYTLVFVFYVLPATLMIGISLQIFQQLGPTSVEPIAISPKQREAILSGITTSESQFLEQISSNITPSEEREFVGEELFQDSYIYRWSNGDDNYEHTQTLLARKSRDSVLLFKTNPTSFDPRGKIINRAELTLYVSSTESGHQTSLKVYPIKAGYNWNISSLTWNDVEKTGDGEILGDELFFDESKLVTSLGLSGRAPKSIKINITKLFQDWASGTEQNGFVVVNDGGKGAMEFYSGEASSSVIPRMSIAYSEVEESPLPEEPLPDPNEEGNTTSGEFLLPGKASGIQTGKLRSVYKYGMDKNTLDFMAANYDFFIIPRGAGSSKVTGLSDSIENYCSTSGGQCETKTMVQYVKVGGVQATDGTKSEDPYYNDVTGQNLFWYSPCGNVLEHDNNWYFVDIISKINPWIDILGNFITKTDMFGYDDDEFWTIEAVLDGIFWDNATSDMQEFMEDPLCENDIPANYSDEAHYSAVDKILRAVRAKFSSPSSKYILFNTYLGYQPEDLRGFELLEGSDGANGIMFEGFTMKTTGVEPHKGRSRILQHIRDTEKMLFEMKKDVYGMNYFYIPERCSTNCGGLSVSQAEELRRFSSASLLLLNHPNFYGYLMAKNSSKSGDDVGQYFPEYTIDLGNPLTVSCTDQDTGATTETARVCNDKTSGLLTRTFEEGIVVLNPDFWGDRDMTAEGPSTRTFTLPALSCPEGRECHFEVATLEGGGSLNSTDGFGEVLWEEAETSYTIARNDGRIFRVVVE